MDLSMIAPPELEELTTCSFCHFPFNDTDAVPKLFTCRHYFCLKCVNLLMRENSDDIVCVNCWKRTVLQGPEPKSENLPNHNGILYLIQNFNTLNMSGGNNVVVDNNVNTNNVNTNTNANANKIINNIINKNINGNTMQAAINRINEERLMSGGGGSSNETNLLTNNFVLLNGSGDAAANNFCGGGVVGGATNNENICIIDMMSEKERSPSIASSSGGSMASSITLGGCVSIGGGGSSIVAYNGTCHSSGGNNNSISGNNNNNNNHNSNNNSNTANKNNYANTTTTTNSASTTTPPTVGINIGYLKFGENCMTHAMPNTLWCSTCSIQLCRACAGTDEHRMHPVRNQIEAKESLHNDISNELQSMHKTLNDVQQLLVKQRDFLVKILESCTTLKAQIESELINPLPTVEIGEMRESLIKAGLCLDLLDKQTPGDALKLYTTLHSEKQRLVAKYQEMFLQCKLDELIKSCGYVFDFDLIKQALIQFHSSAVSGCGGIGNDNGLEIFMSMESKSLINGINQSNHHQNPVLFLANYCISQLYSRNLLVLKQQQQNQQQQQHQQQKMQQHQQHHDNQGINIANQINQQHQQALNFNNNNFNQQLQQPDPQIQTNQQQFQNQSTLLPNGFLNTLISNLSSNTNINNNNNNNSNNDTAAQQTTYAQALQQSSTSKAQQQQQQQQQPIGQHVETPISKSYAAIINNANKTNLQVTTTARQQQQHQQHQQQQQQKSTMLQQTLTKTTQGNEFPVLAPIGTRCGGGVVSSSSSSSSSSTAAAAGAATLNMQRTTATHIFTTKATASATSRNDLNGLNLSLLHLQHHQSLRTQQQQQPANGASNTAKQQQQQQQLSHQQQQHQHQNQSSKSSTLVLNPSVHIYPIYYFNIEIEGEHCGRFLIEVRHDVAPKMAKNFNALVTQEFGFGYKGCQVFQCWDNESIITGDYELNNGRGGRSVFEEAFFLPEDTKILGIRGSVGMRRSQKRHDNMGLVGSQFRIILREMRGFTGIFGFVIDGLELIERISKVGDPTGRPQSTVIISSCGKYQ